MRPLAPVLIGLLAAGAVAQPAADLEFFETKIRPLLATHCFGCHGPKKQRSDLRLDHIEFLLKGGERGPALVPRQPAQSRILEAVGYENGDLQMPPKRRLPSGDVALLRQWVAMGAPWPDEPRPADAQKKPAFDLAQRRADHWSWRPLTRPTPPAVEDPEWSQGIDPFVRTRMRAAGLQPAPPADRPTLLRRVTFDLIGLPPTLTEQDAFLADEHPGAFARVVDRLLASPHFGEHWARHWLDLVRYADTLGHEFDYEIPNAYRYRDYVIRAFQTDLPYDQFVREQIAGDLLPHPRRDAEGCNESVLGTGFYWLGEQTHAPVDVRKHLSDRTHNQIDVLSQAFLGLTVGCARCHDHKFDAISTADYYALSGFLKSSRYMQIDGAPAAPAGRVADYLRAQAAFTREVLDTGRAARAELGRTMLAGYLAGKPPAPPEPKGKKKRRRPPQSPPPANPTERWQRALAQAAVERDPLHPMHAFGRLRTTPDKDVRPAWRAAAAGRQRDADALTRTGARPFVDFRTAGFAGWFTAGPAFGDGPTRTPIVLRRRDGGAVVQSGGWAFSGRRGRVGQGVLHSPTFTIDKRYMHVLAFGREARMRVVLEGFNIIRNPIYGQLHQFVNQDTPRWYTIDLSMWRGREAFLALNDQSAPAMADPSRVGGYPEDGYLAVQQIWFADERALPTPQAGYPAFVLGNGDAPIDSAEAVADLYVGAIGRALDALADGSLGIEAAHLLNWLYREKLLTLDADALAQAEAALNKTRFSPGMRDGTGADEHVYIRGGHNTLGPIVPRRILEGLGGTKQRRLRPQDGSGRLALADAMLADSNPYPARVLVNRLWHHLFGRGLVATVDNFGVLGEAPTHPQLLDWLATTFRADGWSIKRALRRMVLSRTYRAASQPRPGARERDPTNRFLSYAAVRRLPGESIRDAILAVSGRLDRTQFGPGVPVHVDAFMTGRGRPRSGPLDGKGRRSIYLTVPRNFLSSFLLAFDLPRPTTAMGRRNVTNVPAQALAMLNDPFVHNEARRFATRIREAEPTRPGRQRLLYRLAFGRHPTAAETSAMTRFLEEQGGIYGASPDDPRPWQDLCHAMLNVKEFLFLR